ncbi:MAG: hypothetical protein R6V56_05010 [Lentisphaeria bacterium]
MNESEKIESKNGLIRFYGAIIKVRNMDQSRAFYSQVLRLGEPVLNTNFWVEFEVVQGQMVIALQQANNIVQRPETDKGDIQCCLAVDDLEGFRQHLSRHEVETSAIERLAVGKDFFRFRDPEGNPLRAIRCNP